MNPHPEHDDISIYNIDVRNDLRHILQVNKVAEESLSCYFLSLASLVSKPSPIAEDCSRPLPRDHKAGYKPGERVGVWNSINIL